MHSEESLFRAFLASLDQETRAQAVQHWWASGSEPWGRHFNPLAWGSINDQHYRLQRAYAAWLEAHGGPAVAARGQFARVLCELAEARARPRTSGPSPDPATEEAFVRDILEHPEDDTPRLVYADWLEERGDVRGAELRLLTRARALAPLLAAEWVELLGLPRRDWPRPGPYHRFGGRARILEAASRLATHLHHDYLGTQHVLIALSREPGAVRAVFTAVGLTGWDVYQEVERVTPPRPDGVPGERLPHSTCTRLMLCLAVEEADARGAPEVDAESLVLGLCRVQPCAASRVLGNLGVTPRDLATGLLTRLGGRVDQWLRARPEVW
jgi:uncharacterized protein (TIGR02996 family)